MSTPKETSAEIERTIAPTEFWSPEFFNHFCMDVVADPSFPKGSAIMVSGRKVSEEKIKRFRVVNRTDYMNISNDLSIRSASIWNSSLMSGLVIAGHRVVPSQHVIPGRVLIVEENK